MFSTTIRETPSEADAASHQLLLRAGFIRQSGVGIFSYLPLARRALTKIENIMREEMNRIGGQELTMPVVHPADVWRETGRWSQVGAEMARLKDRNGHDLVLAMTHEEVVTDLARKEIRSYRQLPQMIYHIQTKFRDDPRPRAGLIRVREFTMLDSYSLDRDDEGLDAQYKAHYDAYFCIFKRCGLPVIAVRSDTGMMGGKEAHEYMYLTPVGEDTLLICDACGYAANRQVANFKKEKPSEEKPQKIEKVATPGVTMIAELAAFLNIPTSRTAKAVFLATEVTKRDAPLLVFAVLRGDMTLNETKLAQAVSINGKGSVMNLRPATDEEIRAIGVEPGYASPIGVETGKAVVIVDDLIPQSPNLVAGANEMGMHLLHTNYGRDYQADVIADIAVAEDGAACPECGNAMDAQRGVEVGNIFKLGTRYSEAMQATYVDQNEQEHLIVMGSYGIGVGRLLACIAEEYHDGYGLAWPVTVAPYQVQLVLLQDKEGVAEPQAEKLYQDLHDAGIEVLYDDRNERPGVKFNDADLLGMPLRVTVAQRSLEQGGVEFKRRDKEEKWLVPLVETVEEIQAELKKMQSEVRERFN
jgi:prolyl-tRNA synthetase